MCAWERKGNTGLGIEGEKKGEAEKRDKSKEC